MFCMDRLIEQCIDSLQHSGMAWQLDCVTFLGKGNIDSGARDCDSVGNLQNAMDNESAKL